MGLLEKLEESFRQYLEACGNYPSLIQITSVTKKLLIMEMNSLVANNFEWDGDLHYRGVRIKINEDLPCDINFYLIGK